jgi:hypothetical protein|tara:strand:- start:117 stop:617 length:501 start_codon:yes stop_codon:yes gene_type:complete
MSVSNNENITQVNELSKRVYNIHQTKKTTSSCFREVCIVVNKNITLNDLYNVDVENFLDDIFPDEGDIWYKEDEYEEKLKRLSELERKRVLCHPPRGYMTIVDKTEQFTELLLVSKVLFGGKPFYNTKKPRRLRIELPKDTDDYNIYKFIVSVSVEEDGTIVRMGG